MLVTIDNLLNADELFAVRDLLAKSTWQSGQLTAGSQAALAKNNQQLDAGALHLHALQKIVLDALNRNPVFFSSTLPLKILPPFFNRYTGETNAYGSHVDNAMRMAADMPGMYMRSDVSATLFLSEPQDYDGGELTIEDTFGNHGIKLAAGSLVLYPSSSIHAVSPVTSGERLASFMFIQSMVRDAGQRRLLHDMDMALLALRSKLGETQALIKLTGTYHNLLRLWVET
jgi:PKHD-type hydroxylase